MHLAPSALDDATATLGNLLKDTAAPAAIPSPNRPPTPPDRLGLRTVWAHREPQKRKQPRRYPYEAVFKWSKGGSNP